MSRLEDRVDIAISRETQTPSVASFGTPAVIAEFPACKTTIATFTFDGDFQASNSIVFTIDGVAADAVVMAVSQANTMALIKAEIEAHTGLTDVNVAISSDNRTLTIVRDTTGVAAISVNITGGASHPTGTAAYNNIFNRTRTYADLTEMTADNWQETDDVYLQAQILFQQDTKVSYIMVGRKKPVSEASETWTQALDAIQVDSADWYGFVAITTGKATVTISGDYVTGATIVATINGIACNGVSWSTDMQTTMGLLKTQIESHIPGLHCTVGLTPFRTMVIEKEDGSVSSVAFVSTGGAQNPTSSAVYTVQDDILLIAAWAETQKKIYFLTSSDADIPASGTSDIFSQIKALNYDRTALCYHPTSLIFGAGWLGECLPFNFPSDNSPAQSWDCKTIKGLTAYGLTSAQRAFIVGASDTDQGKRGNIYTTTAGIDNTEKGIVASGENIEVIAGIDWLESRIAENVFTEKVQSRLIPETNAGIQVIEGRVREILETGKANGLISEIVSLTVPDEADISQADKNVGLLEDVQFEIHIARAIKKIKIRGRVTG